MDYRLCCKLRILFIGESGAEGIALRATDGESLWDQKAYNSYGLFGDSTKGQEPNPTKPTLLFPVEGMSNSAPRSGVGGHDGALL